MATIATPQRRPLVSKFYVTMAAICVAIAFGGFFGTYWLQVGRGTFSGSPMLHLHGLLVADRRLKTHRAWGLAGISLATAMLFTGMAVAIQGLGQRLDAGYGDAARAFAIVPISGILMFAGFVTAALLNLRRPEWHKRFMLVATVSILQAAIARFFFLAATGGGPGMRPGIGPPMPIGNTTVAGLISQSLIVAAMVHDWRSHGRVHAAYWWGLGIVSAVFVARPVVGYSDAWYRTADFLISFGG